MTDDMLTFIFAHGLSIDYFDQSLTGDTNGMPQTSNAESDDSLGNKESDANLAVAVDPPPECITCDAACQEDCQEACQEMCEGLCQDLCDSQCQDTCDAACDAACQDACQEECVVSCEIDQN